MGEIRNCPNGTAECNNQLCPSLRQCSLRQITAQRTLRLRQELRAEPAFPAAKKPTCLMSKSWRRRACLSRRWALAPPRSSGSLLNQERPRPARSEEHTSELQSLMRISYPVFSLKKKIH